MNLNRMQMAVFGYEALHGRDGGPVQRADLDKARVDGAVDNTVFA